MQTRNDRLRECLQLIHIYETEKSKALAALVDGSEERESLERRAERLEKESERLALEALQIREQLNPSNSDMIAADYDSKIARLKRRMRKIRLEPKVRELEKKDKELTRALKRLKTTGINTDVLHEQLAAVLERLAESAKRKKEEENGPANQG